MNSPAPHLLTLLDWSRRLAAGEDCAELAQWRSASPDADWQWPRVMLAVEMLDAGLAGGELPEMDAAVVAALLDGGLDEAAEAATIETCWQSPAQLAEAASGARFGHESTLLADVSDGLTQRLLELGPQPVKWRLNGEAAPLPIAEPLAPPQVKAVGPASVQPISVAPRPQRENWIVLASALTAAALLIGAALGWLAASNVPRRAAPPPIANNPVEPARQPQTPPEPPRHELPREPEPRPSSPTKNTEEPTAVEPPISPAPQIVPQTNVPPPVRPKRTLPAIPPRSAPPPAPPQLAFRTAQGALLVQDGGGPWRVAAGERPLSGPLRIVSLAESYTTVEVPAVGTLVCEGPAELAVAPRDGGGLEILLAHGRLGVIELAAGAHVRFQTAAATWTARGVDHYSTLAVLADPVAPQMLVSSGAVAADQQNVATQQRILWQQGLPQPPQPIAAGSAVAANAAPRAIPALGDPLDLAWMTPPDAERRKQWETLYGRLVDRLTLADDASSELTKLLAASKDQRTAALLSRWNAAVTDDAGRAAQVWAMLGDHRAFVRVAGVRSLLEMPPGDPRLAQFDRLLHQKLNADASNRVLAWLADVRQPAPLAGPRAVELVDFLGHAELPLRQLAVSLLELHAAPALQQARALPPAYDPAGTAARRAAGQREWRQNLRRIFAPAKPAAAAALAPAAGS